jgi:hypothetical protein
MRLIVTEKRKFNYVVLGLLAVTIAAWAMRIAQEGQLFRLF